MRTTSQVNDRSFPFARRDVPFVLVVGERARTAPDNPLTKDGRGFEHASAHDQKYALIRRAQDLQEAGVECSLLAMWPGKTRSDVFLVDDLSMALAAMGATPPA